MAKLGEGDERWIVEERADGANVHGWHWSEKDCLGWSRERLGELVGAVAAESADGTLSAKVTGVESVEGEAYINIRKGKMIPGYEIEAKFSWEGTIKDGSGNQVATVNGRVILPYVADENADDDETEVRVTTATEGPAAAKLKELMVRSGKPAINEAVRRFVADFAAGGPAKAGAAPNKHVAPKAGAAGGGGAAAAAPKPKAELKDWERDRRTVELTERFYCRATDVFECLVDENRVRAFTMAPATSAPSPGGPFSWFGGSVEGVFEELAPGQRLVMRWRFSTWADGCFSKVVITLKEPDAGNTVLELKQTGLPEADRFGNEDVFENTEKGWKDNIFEKIRKVFGYGC